MNSRLWTRAVAGAASLFLAMVLASALGTETGAAAAVPGRGSRVAGQEVLTWGRNQYGQLGNDTTAMSSVVVSALLPAGTTVKQVAGGYGFSLALTSSGQVWAWGDNSSGQLGIGTTSNSLVPVRAHLPAGTTVTAIAAGDDHVLALTSTGGLLAWGYNDYGQVGDATTTERHLPVAVHLPAGTTVTAIGAGAGHSLAVTSTGSVLAWGYNNTGQLGLGNTTDRHVPTQVPLPDGVTATAVAGGSAHSLVLTDTGQMWSWGYNRYGQLGNNSTTQSNNPVQVHLPAGTTVTAIAGGRGFHSLALESTGRMLAWGDNGYGQLGNATNTTSLVPIQVHLPAGTTVTQIAGGDEHSLALTDAGQILAWGYNRYGQLGDGTTTNSNLPVEVQRHGRPRRGTDSAVPVQVRLPAGVTALAIGSGGFHGLAITALPAAKTTTTLRVSPRHQVHGGPVTLTADVECAGGTATGSVVFMAGTTRLGTAALHNGRATLTVHTLAVGTHSITAHYEGDAGCEPSISAPATITITPRPGPHPTPHPKPRPKPHPGSVCRINGTHSAVTAMACRISS